MAVSNLFSNVIFLGSFSLAWVGWIVALAGVASTTALVGAGSFHLIWWTIIFVLLILLGLTYVIISNSLEVYRLVITQSVTLAAALLTVSASTFTSAYTQSQIQALEAGLIILCIVFYFWLYYLSIMQQPFGGGGLPALPTFQSTNPNIPPPTQTVQDNSRNTFIPSGARPASRASPEVLGEAQTNKPARALFDYQANPNDPNEISFSKDEILMVIDDKGKWWRVRKANGQLGIVPSNYMEIMQV